MNRFFSDKKAIMIFLLPALIFFVILVIVPIAVSAYYSLLDWKGVGEKTFIGFKNYIDMFADKDNLFGISIWHSLILAALSLFVQIPIAMVLALVIARKTKGEGVFRSIYFIPVIISTAVLGQLWYKIYHPDNGLLNTILRLFGFDANHGWLSAETVLGAVFFVMIWQYIGYHMLLMYSQIKTIPQSLYEAAEIDGASSAQMARKITIPLITPMIKVCATFAIIGSLKAFDLIWVLSNSRPMNEVEVPATRFFVTAISQMRYGMGSAMAVFILIECLIFTVVLQRVFKAENYEY